MSSDAIEKLSQYRKESKNTDISDPAPPAKGHGISPLRKFFISFYFFNVVIAATIGFALLFTGWKTFPPFIVWGFLSLVSFSLAVLTLRTIQRLQESKGRKTTIDDSFVILLLIADFFIYIPYLSVPILVYQMMHIALTVLWLLQIYFVSIRKPDFSTLEATTGGIVEQGDDSRSLFIKVKDFLTPQRQMLFGVSFILGLLLSLPILLS